MSDAFRCKYLACHIFISEEIASGETFVVQGSDIHWNINVKTKKIKKCKK